MSGWRHGSARLVAALGLLLALLALAPIRAHAAGHRPATAWTARATIYGWDRGRWRQERFLTTEQAVKAVLVFHPRTAAWSAARALMVVQHFTWDGFRRDTQAPVLRLRLQRHVLGPHTTVFTAITRLPLTLPVNFSFVTFDLQSGSLRGSVRSGIRLMPPIMPTFPALSVPQAFAFCTRTPRTRLAGLPYGMVLQGYYYSTPSGGDGPNHGEILAKPGYVSPPRLPGPLSGERGILTAADLAPPDGRRIPVAGILGCSHALPSIFVIYGYGPQLDRPAGTNVLLTMLLSLTGLGIIVGIVLLPLAFGGEPLLKVGRIRALLGRAILGRL